ncbi:MAG: hypothetical protein ACTS41_01925 [Candidatus Hodgkinia cicadicola]
MLTSEGRRFLRQRNSPLRVIPFERPSPLPRSFEWLTRGSGFNINDSPSAAFALNELNRDVPSSR